MSTVYVPCVGPQPENTAPNPVVVGQSQVVEAKGFFLDQSTLLLTGALSWLAAQAVNSFVQSLFALSIPKEPSQGWQLVLWNFVYVALVVTLAIALMFPLARSKAKRDKIKEDAAKQIPSLVKCVNCAVCPVQSAQ